MMTSMQINGFDKMQMPRSRYRILLQFALSLTTRKSHSFVHLFIDFNRLFNCLLWPFSQNVYREPNATYNAGIHLAFVATAHSK